MVYTVFDGSHIQLKFAHLCTNTTVFNREFCLTRHSKLLSIHGCHPKDCGLAPALSYRTLSVSQPRPARNEWQLSVTMNDSCQWQSNSLQSSLPAKFRWLLLDNDHANNYNHRLLLTSSPAILALCRLNSFTYFHSALKWSINSVTSYKLLSANKLW